MINREYKQITSQDNTQIKLLQKLKAKKYRHEFRQFAVENLAIIFDALKDGYDFEALFVTEEFRDKHPEKLKILEDNSQAPDFYLISRKLNERYSYLDTPSGITAIYSMRTKELDSSSVVYLNNIGDPGNIGTIMRSALAFNFNNVVLDKDCADIYNPKVISAAKDAIFKLNILEDNDGGWIQGNKLPVYTADSGHGVDIADLNPARVFCLVLGSESHGVSPDITKLAETSIRIGISAKIESLNVSAAAAILLYELRKK